MEVVEEPENRRNYPRAIREPKGTEGKEET